jgi:hypothetical protein
LLIVLALLALSIGEASASGTEPDGEVRLEDIGLDADDLEDLAERAAASGLGDLGVLDRDERDLDRGVLDGDERDRDALASDELDRDGLATVDLAADDLAADDLAADELAADDLAADDFAADLAANDLADDGLAAADRVAWPATGATDARAAALARRHSRLGRLDLSLTWRRTEPVASPPRDEVWLYGTWRL